MLMNMLFWTVLILCQAMTITATATETFEKFYTTDASYSATNEQQQQHSAMGISTLAKFSMLSNTPTLFRVQRPGLNNDVNSVSLESMQKPGFYLRYKNYKFHMEKNDETELFKKDATFRERLGPKGRAYELLGRDNWFMCHNDVTPFTLKARSERIGTQDFVNNCVYVPVKQDLIEKKNIVKTLPFGGAMVVNHVPDTQNTDKCISIRFVNHIGGPVRVVSSLKPEGYLVTANAFKLKTIFKHANHKQRHVIFYAENVQDRDDDVMLNNKNVFTVKPRECLKDFENVILSSQAYEQAAKADAAITNDVQNTTPSPNNNLTAPSPPETAEGTFPTLPPLNDELPKPPRTSDNGPKTHGSTPSPSGGIVAKTTPPIMNIAKPTTSVEPVTSNTFKPLQLNAPASEINKVNPPAIPTPLTTQNVPKPPNFNKPINPPPSNVMPSSIVTANEVGVLPEALSRPEIKVSTPASYTAPLKQQIQRLDNVLEKRINTQPSPSVTSGILSSYNTQTTGYEQWSSFGPCSVSCGVGTRRRSRVCKPGSYCYGPAAETRACIKEQCVSNCIHTVGGTVRSGSCCHFPFAYNGAQYYHCILSPKNNERMWCATTPYFEQDKQWGYCPRSTKAPQRSIVKPFQPTVQHFPLGDTESSFENNLQYYNNPYTSQDDAYVPCSAMCSRLCEASCPRHCCRSVRADLPVTAYMGNNYDRNDKRSSIFPYQRRYTRRLYDYRR